MRMLRCAAGAMCALLLISSASRLPAQSSEEAPHWLFDDEPLLSGLKNQDLGNGWTYSAGAELRHRYMDERNRLRPMGQTTRNTYHLTRFAPFTELKNDNFTLFLQGIDAESFDEELAPLPIDVNRADILQLYVDLNLYDWEHGGTLHAKAGRQFLKYGSEHLISPLPWANTYRNFEGFKLYYTDEAWSIDGFAVQPVNGAASPDNYRPYSSDQRDYSQWLSGVYATYKQLPQGTLDLYWLWSREEDRQATRLDGNRHTVGARWAGSRPLLEGTDFDGALTQVWDYEGAYQFGKDDLGAGTNLDVRAGFLSSTSGVTFNELPWTPTVSGVFWWGSGDGDPNDGEINTVSTLHPLGHAYWGFIDNFNGSNLRDYSMQLTMKPTDKLTLLAAWHAFQKDEAADFVWNIAGAPLGNTTTPSDDIGQELDLVATMQFNQNLQVQAGYFWFWYDAAVSQNAPALGARGDAQQFYLMTTWSF